MTPLKSIRKYCLWCCNNHAGEIRHCQKIDCEFYKFRMGKKTKRGSLIKIIRKRCFDCGEGTSQAIKKCEFNDCQLFPYRNGKSPAHKLAWTNRLKRPGMLKNNGLIAEKNINQGILI